MESLRIPNRLKDNIAKKETPLRPLRTNLIPPCPKSILRKDITREDAVLLAAIATCVLAIVCTLATAVSIATKADRIDWTEGQRAAVYLHTDDGLAKTFDVTVTSGKRTVVKTVPANATTSLGILPTGTYIVAVDRKDLVANNGDIYVPRGCDVEWSLTATDERYVTTKHIWLDRTSPESAGNALLTQAFVWSSGNPSAYEAIKCAIQAPEKVQQQPLAETQVPKNTQTVQAVNLASNDVDDGIWHIGAAYVRCNDTPRAGLGLWDRIDRWFLAHSYTDEGKAIAALGKGSVVEIDGILYAYSCEVWVEKATAVITPAIYDFACESGIIMQTCVGDDAMVLKKLVPMEEAPCQNTDSPSRIIY